MHVCKGKNTGKQNTTRWYAGPTERDGEREREGSGKEAMKGSFWPVLRMCVELSRLKSVPFHPMCDNFRRGKQPKSHLFVQHFFHRAIVPASLSVPLVFFSTSHQQVVCLS